MLLPLLDAADAERVWGDSPMLHVPFVSAFAQVKGKEPRYTNFTKGFKGCIDYIFIEKGCGLRAQAVVAWPHGDAATLSAEVALPNSEFPSDHLSLVTRIDIIS